MTLNQIRHWLSLVPLWLLVTVVLILLGVATFSGYKLYGYTENNPRFCASCHIMDTAYAKWSNSVHKGVNCHDCHKLSYIERGKLVASFLFKRPVSVPLRHGKIIVPYTVCIQCHLQGPVSEAHPIRGTAGHKKHFFDEGVECTRCHGTKLHEFLPESGFCTHCHRNIKVHSEVMAGFDCLTCHDFLSKSASTLIPERKVCLSCHQEMSPTVPFPTNLDTPMQLNCNTCHDPHEKIKPTVADCFKCHDETLRFGLHRIQHHQECKGCHIPHAWKVTSRGVCLDCHKKLPQHRPGKRCDQCHEFRDLRMTNQEGKI